MKHKNKKEAFIQEKHHLQQSESKPHYVKPQATIFLDQASQIKSGASNVLESQGNGYLSS